ncbi:MAG: LPS-assembly protein LptD, partial [Betaproteobacteria bacterium]|nr:LPS-assembly protein LptD [Betaproteobacteria bacterium]
QETINGGMRKELPTYLQSNQISGQTDLQTLLEGQVVLRRGDILLKADQIDYDQVLDLAKARGNVYINHSGNSYQGPALDIQLDAFEGFFTQPEFFLNRNKMYGKAERIDFIDPGNSVMQKGEFTTCKRKPGPNWTPDWFFKGDKISFDSDHNLGNAEGASLRFKNVPVMPLPALDFALNDERKSGLLPPTIGVDSVGGLEVIQPYYWNLAPNRDMTFTPTYWSSRGMRLETEFRYLEAITPQPPFTGVMRFDYMAKDSLRDSQRWAFNASHAGMPYPAFAGGALGLTYNINRVSDDNYWKDFTSSNSLGVTRLLSNDMNVTWGKGFFTSNIAVQKWQTMQDLATPSNYIAPPFDRAPQMNVKYSRANIGGFDFMLDGQFSRFETVRQEDCLTNYLNCNAQRAVGQAQVSRPFVTPYGYVTPKFIMNTRSYQFDDALSTNGQTSASVSVPTFSLDSGVVFERGSNLLGREWTQTFEPRAFYVYSPYRSQNYLPNYDSGANAYNFASIFSENTYGGYDRIADSNMVTLGATSRFIDPKTGAEGARFGLAQRLRIKDQLVTLPIDKSTNSPIAQAGLSDVLAGATLNLSRKWAVDSTVQYNPDSSRFLSQAIGGRYTPGSYRVISASYRDQTDTTGTPQSRFVNVGWQWPLNDMWGVKDEELGEGRGLGEGRWYSVARMNMDTLNNQMVESVIGFEYDGGCWLGRVVKERFQVAENLARQKLLFQLEFVGFSRVGTNALGSIRNNVPRYQHLRQPLMTPSRFGNYE